MTRAGHIECDWCTDSAIVKLTTEEGESFFACDHHSKRVLAGFVAKASSLNEPYKIEEL